nr:RUN [Hymenolepis microstoma]
MEFHACSNTLEHAAVLLTAFWSKCNDDCRYLSANQQPIVVAWLSQPSSVLLTPKPKQMLLKSNAFFHDIAEEAWLLSVNQCTRVKTTVGKGRLLLRTLAYNSGLADFVKLLMENKPFIYEHYERGKAVFTNEVQCQIFFSFIADFKRIKFDLNLTHADFLDTTWDIPVYKYKDFVPCGKLGIKVRFIDSYYIITDFEEGFVEEDNFFELGDVITSISGTALRGRVINLQKFIAKECRKLLQFEIVKLVTENGSFFGPIVNLIKKGNIPNILGSNGCPLSEDKSLDWPALEFLDLSKCYAALSPRVVDTTSLETKFPQSEVRHTLRYIGSVDMGSKSDKIHIPEAIDAVLAKNPVAERYMPVRVRLGELDVAFWPVLPNSESSTVQEEPYLKFFYRTISAVGRDKKSTRYFGFIAGNSASSMATNFTAYAFLALTPGEALRIVKGISSGFKRTNWMM